MGKNKTVFVAMSGGVDSSVAAALLKKAGFDVVGVFMKPWQSQSLIVNQKSLTDCMWKEDREDALRVAAKLDIPLLTWDLSGEYEKYVASYMVEGYRKGITPNPDVMCNKFIKFGVFLEKALEMGADFIATGHYARKREVKSKKLKVKSEDEKGKTEFKLLKAKDQNKDQSYFLYTLTQKQLKHCLFPIGDWTKIEVRKMAKKFGLPNWNKKDSQGVCFVGPFEVSRFLKEYIKPKEGIVVRKSDGKILGKHDGVWYYTIGQRHGFGLNGGRPYYIIEKDIKKNILYVSDSFKISNPRFQIKDFNWINGAGRSLPLDCKVKMRHRQKDLDCSIIENGSDKALIEIKEDNLPIAPGQSAVFYKRNEVLGGGIIT